MSIKASISIEYDPTDIPGTLLKEIKKLCNSLGYPVCFDKSSTKTNIGEKIKNNLPEDIKDLDRSAFSKVLLAVMKRYHIGKADKAYSKEIAKEIISDFPEMAEEYDYKLGKISFAIIFAMDNGRGGLVRDDLVKMEHDDERNRLYWVEK